MSSDPMDEKHDPSGAETSRIKRFLPLVALVGAAAAIYAFDLETYLSFETLRDHRHTLTAFVERNVELAALLFIAVYAAATPIL